MDCVADNAFAAAENVAPDPLAPTVFHTEWWLNAATGGDWGEALVKANGQTVGRFPYILRHMFGRQTLCTMPPLTHFLGPAVVEGKGAACNRALKRAQITRDLIAQMPRSGGFYHKFSREITDTLMFQEQGYWTSVQFTYEVAPAPTTLLWRNMRDKTRNVIRRAEEAFTVMPCLDPEEFTAAYERNLQQRGMQNDYDKAMLVRLCAAAAARGQGQILAARGAGGAMEAGNGAVALLLWHAMQESAARGLIFDFDGVGLDGSRLFFTGFGGEVRPRYIASRYTIMHRVAGRLSDPFHRRKWTMFC